jgi:hypothetical protein
MPFGSRHLKDIRPSNIDQKRWGKFVRENWGVQPIAQKNDGASAASGTTGDTNILVGPNSNLNYFIIGAGQTITCPVWADATGLDIGLDATDNEGLEIHAGVGALSSGTFVIGTDRSFYLKATFKIADVSCTDEFLVGFRKNEAVKDLAGVYSTYTDFAAIGIVASDATAKVQLVTRLNSGTVSTVDTTNTWADGATKTLKVVVKDDGYVRFYLNEADPAVTKTNFLFDTGDSVNWFIRHVRCTTAANAVNWKSQTLTIAGQSVDQPALEYGYLRRNGE